MKKAKKKTVAKRRTKSQEIIEMANESIQRARSMLHYAADVASLEGDVYAYGLLCGALRVLGERAGDNELKVIKNGRAK